VAIDLGELAAYSYAIINGKAACIGLRSSCWSSSIEFRTSYGLNTSLIFPDIALKNDCGFLTNATSLTMSPVS
jgi:hypothetical protein